MPQWTEQQQQAIEARNSTLLVSAAAGSGKTAVLVARIVSLLREGARLDRMMICTFTRAAAGEMRSRLAETLMKELADDPKLRSRALDQLENTEISTIHSFCQRLLREEFQAAGIDPMFAIATEAQRKTLFAQSFDDAMNALLAAETPDADFTFLAEGVSTQTLREWVDSLYGFMMSLPHPFLWLDEKLNELSLPIEQRTVWVELLRAPGLALDCAEAHLAEMRKLLDEPDAVSSREAVADGMEDGLRALRDACSLDPESLRRAVDGFAVPAAKAARNQTEEQKAWLKRFNASRDAISDVVKTELSGAADALLPPTEADLAEEAEALKLLRGLRTLMIAVHSRFRELKLKANVLDFSDLEQMTLEVLENDEVSARQRQNYDHLFVDECQDVSAVQDAIVSRLHGEGSSLFMVGDVKQSIYRFRLADPLLFLGRMKSFSHEADAAERRIDLQQNFRSRFAILDAANRTFRTVMREDVNEIGYAKEDELVCGAPKENDPPVEVVLVSGTAYRNADGGMEEVKVSSAPDQLKEEGVFMAERMRALHDSGTAWRDMVVLMPVVSKKGDVIRDVLRAHNIPVYFDGGESYYDIPELREVRALLEAIDNPLQDLPLIGALKLSPFLMRESDLARIRLCEAGRNVPFHKAFAACCEKDDSLGRACREAREQLHTWHFAAQTEPLADFLWELLRETGIYAAAGAMPMGPERQANLSLLCTQAAAYEQSLPAATLHGFLQNIREISQTGEDRQSARLLGENEDLVRIMTMHKSKGLQFPVVFLAGISGDRRMGKRSLQLKFHSKLGLCAPCEREEPRTELPMRWASAFDRRKADEERAERCRLLYVAMTRAQDRMILVCSGERESFWRMPPSAYRVGGALCQRDWVLQTVYDDLTPPEDLLIIPDGYTDACRRAAVRYTADGLPWSLSVWYDTGAQLVSDDEAVERYGQTIQDIAETDTVTDLPAVWEELRPVKCGPLKTSVTALVHPKRPLKVTEDGTLDPDEDRETVSAPVQDAPKPDCRPAFMVTEEHRLTGAERGTVIHKAFALFDLKKIAAAPQTVPELLSQLDGFVRDGLMTEKEKEAVYARDLARFYESELGRRVLASPRVQREWQFNQRYGDGLLQGVIDLAFMENGAFVVVDYKTDRLDHDEDFVTRYAAQLKLYAGAIREITRIPVSELWIFSVRLGRAIRVPEE